MFDDAYDAARAYAEPRDELSRRIGEMAVAGLQAVSTFWMEIDSPTLATSYTTPGCTPGPENSCETWVNSGTVGFLHSHVTAVSTWPVARR